MRKHAALVLVCFQLCAIAKLNALDRSSTQAPKHGRLAVASKSRWVPVYGDSKFKIADNMIATLFVEKGSLTEYKHTGVWPQSSSFLLRLKQIPAVEDAAKHRTVVVDIAYKNNPETQQWESYSVSWRYDTSDVRKPTTDSRSRSAHPGCRQRSTEETESGGPEFL